MTSPTAISRLSNTVASRLSRNNITGLSVGIGVGVAVGVGVGVAVGVGVGVGASCRRTRSISLSPALQGWVGTVQVSVPPLSVASATINDRVVVPSRPMKSRAWPVTSMSRSVVTRPDCHEIVPMVVVPVTAAPSA